METEVCPRCNGKGHIDRTPASIKFPVGAPVWWACSVGQWYYGYAGETFIPATVDRHSASGKRVRIAIQNLRYKTTDRTYVDPARLSERPADSAKDGQ